MPTEQPNNRAGERPRLILEEQQEKLIVGERIVPLSRGKFHLFSLLYQQHSHWLETARGPRCLKVETLTQRTSLSRRAIPRLISRANERLKCHHWVIAPIYSWGYALFPQEEVDEVSEGCPPSKRQRASTQANTGLHCQAQRTRSRIVCTLGWASQSTSASDHHGLAGTRISP